VLRVRICSCVPFLIVLCACIFVLHDWLMCLADTCLVLFGKWFSILPISFHPIFNLRIEDRRLLFSPLSVCLFVILPNAERFARYVFR